MCATQTSATDLVCPVGLSKPYAASVEETLPGFVCTADSTKSMPLLVVPNRHLAFRLPGAAIAAKRASMHDGHSSGLCHSP